VKGEQRGRAGGSGFTSSGRASFRLPAWCELLRDCMRAAAERDAAGGELDAVQHVAGHLGIEAVAVPHS